MTKLKGTTWEELDKVLFRSKNKPALIGNNTVAERDPDNSNIIVRLHGNAIVVLSDDGDIEISLSGWNTVTTRERVNQFLPAKVRVRQLNWESVLDVDGVVTDLDVNECVKFRNLAVTTSEGNQK